LRSERPGINPVIASPLLLAKPCHTTSPSSSPLSVEGFAKGPNVNGVLKLANFFGAGWLLTARKLQMAPDVSVGHAQSRLAGRRPHC
jgi:hypothetical protein